MRTEVVRAFLDGRSTTLNKQTTTESIFLQVRHILELIALSSLVAHKTEYASQRKKFRKFNNANDIVGDLRKKNPHFYPEPTSQVIDPESGKVTEVVAVKNGYLTEQEFCNVLGRCGDLLHAENPFAKPKEADRFLKVVPEWMGKIMSLLSHHQIKLNDSDLQLWVIMNAEKDGRVHASLMKRVGEHA